MEIDDPKIITFKEMVRAAREEFEMAVAFHEIWKPAAYDTDLHNRMGESYASQAVLVIRTALRREMLLALARLWSDNKNFNKRTPIRMDAVRIYLSDQKVFEALVMARGQLVKPIAQTVDLERMTDRVFELIDKYTSEKSEQTILKELRVCPESLGRIA